MQGQRPGYLTPTELPKRKRSTHREGKDLEKEASRPNTAVKNSVALNAALRPIRSEPVTSMIRTTVATGNEVKRRTCAPTDSSEHHSSKH